MKDKKGAAAMLVGGMPKPEEKGDGEYGREACGEDMMRALDAKDPAAFMAALDAYLDLR